LTKI
jgi:septal ring factor EnvC (AmiA/AmiB activator)